MNISTTPEAVTLALQAVKAVHPEVCQVFYGFDGRWLYTDENMDSPTFGDSIDVSLLEDAANAVDNSVGFPAAFAL